MRATVFESLCTLEHFSNPKRKGFNLINLPVTIFNIYIKNSILHGDDDMHLRIFGAI